MADKRVSNEISVKVNVEVSEAITGLKALQREAKAATKALAELREEQVEFSVQEAARTLEKALENSNVGVDVSQLQEALYIVSSIESHRFSGREAGEKLQKLFDEIDAGER
ncbi:hypothetical protein P4T18_18120 [Bacillus inaquosorum]|uniref:hypothetical protein n=1 Tax=Bacillus inaquosorum TaxID=483913 RepID=UPI002E24AB8D|nr:hypothetical protein [Bacillus inaquosorum]